MSVTSNLTQRILSQSNNISYMCRGVYRMNSVPEDRQADYAFRDIFMVVVTGFLTELGFRLAETLYSFPLMTKLLGLDKLSEIYKNDRYFKGADKIKDIGSIADVDALRKRIIGSLVKPASDKDIPTLFESVDLKHMSEAERAQYQALAHHLKRRLNFHGPDGYLDRLVTLGLRQEDATFLKEHLTAKDRVDYLDKMFSKYFNITEATQTLKEEEANVLNKLLDESLVMLEKFGNLPRNNIETLRKELSPALNQGKVSKEYFNAFMGALRKVPTLIKEKLETDGREEVVALFKDSQKSKDIFRELVKIQKTSAWPKLAASIAFTFFFYGIVASFLDNKIIQPWQKRVVAERGTSREVVPPTYLSLVPASVAMLFTMCDKMTPPFVKKLGYLNRFAVGGVLSLGVYIGSVLWMVKRALSKPPIGAPIRPEPTPLPLPEERPPIYHPNAFRQFESLALNSGTAGPRF